MATVVASEYADLYSIAIPHLQAERQLQRGTGVIGGHWPYSYLRRPSLGDGHREARASVVTDFRDLLAEVERGEARRLVDKAIGAGAVRLLIVQRADGSIWEAEDWLRGSTASEAVAWSLPVLERLYLSQSRMMPWPESDIDSEALFRHINRIKAQDEVAAAIEAAEYLVGVRR